jgi:hypothetical protein
MLYVTRNQTPRIFTADITDQLELLPNGASFGSGFDRFQKPTCCDLLRRLLQRHAK